jgi:hypothetical protein
MPKNKTRTHVKYYDRDINEFIGSIILLAEASPFGSGKIKQS